MFVNCKTSIVKMKSNPDLLSSKINSWAFSVLGKLLSKENIWTGLDDRSYFPFISTASDPERSPILSSGRNLINGSSLQTYIIDPSVEKFV